MNIDETKIALRHFAGIPRLLVEEFVDGHGSFCRQRCCKHRWCCGIALSTRRSVATIQRKRDVSHYSPSAPPTRPHGHRHPHHAARGRHTLRHPRARVGLRGDQWACLRARNRWQPWSTPLGKLAPQCRPLRRVAKYRTTCQLQDLCQLTLIDLSDWRRNYGERPNPLDHGRHMSVERRDGLPHGRAVGEVVRKEGEAAILWFKQVLCKWRRRCWPGV